MIRYAFVGLAGVLVGALCVWFLRPRAVAEETQRASTPRVQAVDRAYNAEERPGRELPTELTECQRTVVRQEVELRTIRAAARQVAALPTPDQEEPAPSPASQEDTAPTADGAPEQISERERQREITKKVRDAVIDKLAVSDEEQQILGDLVCSQRENLHGLYADFAAGRLTAEELFGAITQERTVADEGMRRSLGAQRVRELRQVGAMGLLEPALCKRR